MRSSSLPARPTKGLPCRSSSRPGASPISMMRAEMLPRAKHRLFAVRLSAQPSNWASSVSSSASVAAASSEAGSAAEAGIGAGAAFAIRFAGDSERIAADFECVSGGCGRATGAANLSTGLSPIASSAPMASYQARRVAAAFASLPVICDARVDPLFVIARFRRASLYRWASTTLAPIGRPRGPQPRRAKLLK